MIIYYVMFLTNKRILNLDDGCVLASTLCKYDLRKGDLFVLGWARVRRVRPLFRAANVWWGCAQYFVIVSCG